MPNDYHLALTDTERAHIETWAFNFARDHNGAAMLLPPRLYSDLKAAGTDMTHMLPDITLDKPGD